MIFAIAIERGDDTTAFGVEVPDLPGCFSAGDTFEEALANAKAAIESHIEILAEDGAELPSAKAISAHVGNPDYEGRIWAVVDADVSALYGKAHKINVTLPEALISKIDRVVSTKKATYKSRSHFLQRAALHELEMA